MNHSLPIALPFEQITEFCQRHPIAKLSLFGSILRDNFHAKSDVDMLVEFVSDSRIGYFEWVRYGD